MLILTRRYGDSIHIGEDVEVVVCGISGSQVRIGVKAPRDVKIVRSELLQNEPRAVSDVEEDSHEA